MAFRDGTGPNGNGPMTGRRMGNCNPDQDFANNNNYGRGYGRGMGMGRRNGGMRNGNRRGFGFDNYEEGPAYHNKSYLESVVSYLSEKLSSYKKRLEDLEDK